MVNSECRYAKFEFIQQNFQNCVLLTFFKTGLALKQMTYLSSQAGRAEASRLRFSYIVQRCTQQLHLHLMLHPTQQVFYSLVDIQCTVQFSQNNLITQVRDHSLDIAQNIYLTCLTPLLLPFLI